jgi:hypothetical protein
MSYFTGDEAIGKRIKCSTKRLLRDGERVYERRKEHR